MSMPEDEPGALRRWLPDIRASEHRAIAAVCTAEPHDGYTVLRSPRFPNFYSGNGLRLEAAALARPLANWVDVFQRHFDPATYRHVTLLVPGAAWTPALQAQADAAGLGVYRENHMAVRPAALVRAAWRPDGIQPLAPLSTPAAAAALYDLHLAESRAADWYTDEADFRALFDKTLAVAEGTGTRWLAIPAPGPAHGYAAALGYFPCGPIVRLQEVITAPAWRTRGLATALLGAAGRMAQDTGTGAVALLADPDGDAHRLYRRLGFADLDVDVTLMRY